MSYNASIPLVTDYMVNSQTQIKSNFQTINAVFSRNHVQLNAPQQGMHNALTFRAQTVDPTTSTSQIALYTKTVGSDTDLFYAPSNTQTPIQLTYPSISTGLASTNPDVYLSQQYTFLAGPFVFYIGSVLVLDGATVTLSPSTTLIYVGLILNAGLGTDKTAGCATNVAGNAFVVRFSSSSPAYTALVYYIAIGV